MEDTKEQVDVPEEQKEDGSDEPQEGTASAVSPSQTSTGPRNRSPKVTEESTSPRLEQIPSSSSKPPVSPFKRKNQKAKAGEEQAGPKVKIGKEKLLHLRKFFESSSDIQGLSWRAIGNATPENRAIPTPRTSNLENSAQSRRENTCNKETATKRLEIPGSVSNQNLESDHRIDCSGSHEQKPNVSQRPTCSTNIEQRDRCQQPSPHSEIKRSPRISPRKDFHSEQRLGASGDASSVLNRSTNSGGDQRPHFESNYLDEKDSCETCKGTCLRQETINEQSSSKVRLRSRSNNRLHELGKSLTNLLPPKRRSRSIEPLSQGESQLRQSQRGLERSPVSPQQEEKGVNPTSRFRVGRNSMLRRQERQQNRSISNLPRSVSRENILHEQQKSPEESAMHQPQRSPVRAPQHHIERSPIPAPQCLPQKPPIPSPHHRRQRSPIPFPLYQQDRSPTPAPSYGQPSSQIPPLLCTQSRLPIPSLSYLELRSRISAPLHRQHWSATRAPQRGQRMSQIPVPLYQHPRAQISPLNPEQTTTNQSPTAQQQNAPPKPPRLHHRIDSLVHQMSVQEHGEAQRERQEPELASAHAISQQERQQSPLPRHRRLESKPTPLPGQQLHRQQPSPSLQRRQQPSPLPRRQQSREVQTPQVQEQLPLNQPSLQDEEKPGMESDV